MREKLLTSGLKHNGSENIGNSSGSQGRPAFLIIATPNFVEIDDVLRNVNIAHLDDGVFSCVGIGDVLHNVNVAHLDGGVFS